MRAGTGQVDITPALGTHLSGDGAGRHRPAKSVRDPLYARALVVESGERKNCLLAMDLLCVTRESTTRIRSEAARRFGLEPDAILVHVEQNHSAPSLGALMLDPDFPFSASSDKEYIVGSESAYVEYAIGNALEAIEKACASLRPVHAAWGRGMVEGLAFNRRGILADGTIGMPWFFSSEQLPLGPTHIRAMEGPFDPEVGVLCLSDENSQPAAILLNFACHPVNVYATDLYAVSGDWPGAWASAMQKAFPGACMPLVLNGCCGNLNPWSPFTPDFKPDSARMGEALAGMSCKVIERLNRSKTSVVDWRTRRLLLAYREVPEERRREADRILTEHPGIKWDAARGEIDVEWFMAASTKSIEYCRKRWPVFPYEIQVFRIGDAAVVGLPGEPFVEGQIEIKLKAPAALVQVAHMCTQYVGYLPTREAVARGGHEASELCPYWAKLAPDSLERIVQEVKSMLAELFP